MTKIDALRERISRLFAEMHLEIPSVGTDLFDAGVIDSWTFAELIGLLEREFGVKTSVDDLEVDNFKSIARIAEFVSARIPSGRGGEARLSEDA